MTIRRAGKPTSRPQLETARSYADDTIYSTCENPDCGRHARVTCASCGGEYCRWHNRHPEHDAPTETR
ncbi:MAG TPA: hypothetical protein VGJ59_19635 [Jatrophihabitantaceae bacterium]|jgi:predicted nucleic acid binding AN1-type Zn finger protein